MSLSVAQQLDRSNWWATFPELRETKAEDLIERSIEDLPSEHDHFSIAVPPRFVRSPRSEEETLTRFSDGGGDEVSVVSALHPHEMSPGDFTEACLVQDGWEVIAKRAVETPLGTLADLLVVRSSHGRTMAQRVNMTRDGSRYFSIGYQCALERLESCASTQAQVLASFRLIHLSGTGLVEKLEPWRAIEPAIIGATLPASFVLAADDSDKDKALVRFDCRSAGKFLGSIHLSQGREPRQLMTEHYGRLKDAGIVLSDRSDPVKSVPPRAFSSASVQSAKGAWGEIPVTCEMHVFTCGEGALLLASTSASMHHDPVGWAATRRALAIACNTAFLV